MAPGDLVLLRLWGRIHEEPATVITLRQITYRGQTRTSVKVLWQGRPRWVDSVRCIGPLPEINTGEVQ